MFRLFVFGLAALAAVPTLAVAGNCHLFRQQQIHATHYGHALNQVAYGHHVQPAILYLVGQQIVNDAHTRKIVDEQISRRLSQTTPQQQGDRQAVGAPQADAAAPLDSRSGAELAKAFCAKCHEGSGSVNPAKFDLSAGIRLSSYKAFTRMARLDEGVPTGMEGVMKKLTPDQKWRIVEHLIGLPTLPEEVSDSTASGELR